MRRRVWYTADLHLGHANIIKLCDRPWDDVIAMDNGLIERWNNVVGERDTVWVLGDFAMGRSHLINTGRLNGTKHLVAGNHDACWTGHRNQARAIRAIAPYRDAGFTGVYPSGQAQTLIAGRVVNLAHLPYRGDHGPEDRFAEHRLEDRGTPLLCGHVHNAWRIRENQINVGVDVWGWHPVAEEELEPILDEMAGVPA